MTLKSLVSLPTLAILSSALLTLPVHAQAIAPVEGNPEFNVPAPVAPVQPAAQPAVELEFENVDVVELLAIIARTFDINISISKDVKGNLPFINLKGKTPEQAIKTIANTEGLRYTKEADGTYIIGRGAPVTESQAPATGGDFGDIKPPTLGATGQAIAPSGIPAPSFGGLAPLESPALEGIQRSAMRPSTELPPLVSTTRAQTRRSTRSIRVRNVKASIMAYWLDPVNNPVPREFVISDQAAQKGYGEQPIARNAIENSQTTSSFDGLGGASQFASPYTNPYVQRKAAGRLSPNMSPTMEWRVNSQFQQGGAGGFGGIGQGQQGGAGGVGGGTFELPGTIDRILAVDPQNVILVAGGSDTDIQDLEAIISVLDRPLRQVEIEAQFVNVTTSDSRSFGIDFSTTQGNFNASNVGFAPPVTTGTFQVGFVRGNFQAQLRALLSKERAKVLTAPRVTAINNLTASIQSLTRQPVILNTTIGGVGGQTGEQENLIFITTSIGLTVTPTINGDDTITVAMRPQLSSQTPTALGVPAISENFVETIANVRDGDTIALGGLKTKNISRGGSKVPFLGDIPFFGSLFRSRNAVDTEGELIIFVTARIVRRAGDDDVVPGT